MGNGPSPEGKLKEGLLQVAQWGADILAVPCNTAHYFINRFREDLPVPLVHIVESTVDLAKEQGPEGSWLLATEGTVKSGVYEEYAKRVDYSLFLPSKEVQNRVQESIRLVKANRTEEGGKLLKDAILDLWKEREIPVIAACTEIPLAYEKTDLPGAMCVSSLAALAQACLEKLYA
jgi:aspartate racemase